MGIYFSQQHNRGSVYPGEYIPLLDAEELLEDLRKSQEPHRPPFVNLSQQLNHYKIEIAIPGFKREDFFISIRNHIMDIVVIHKIFPGAEEGTFQLHEFNYEPFEHSIALPEDADASFVRADYQAGVLTIHMSKTAYPQKETITQIVVY